jgi:WD40 repeat protein
MTAEDVAPRLPLLPYLRSGCVAVTGSNLTQKLRSRSLLGGRTVQGPRSLMTATEMTHRMQHHQTSRGHQFAVYCVTFDKAGRYIITGSDDTFVKVLLCVHSACNVGTLPAVKTQDYLKICLIIWRLRRTSTSQFTLIVLLRYIHLQLRPLELVLLRRP